MKTYKDPWYESYARSMLNAKGYQQASEEMVAQATGILRTSVERIYRAVAFDVDGTLTADDPTSLQHAIVPVDREMAQVVAELLVRGVPVILITGRGASAKNAAADIRSLSNLSGWQIRRLYCVPYNGVCLWRTPLNDAQRFLGDQVTFFDWEKKDEFARALTKEMARIGDRHSELLFDPKAQSLRVIAPDRELRDLAFGVATDLVDAHDWDKTLFVAKGLYSKNQWSLDVSPTNKRLALDKTAEFLDIPRNRILCIGDQGDRDGNDFDLLDSDSGFSVGDFSNTLTACFPIFSGSDDHTTLLKGAAATRELLKRVRIFPELCIRPNNKGIYLRDLRRFEQLALIRSRKETDAVIQHLRLRLKYLIDENVAVPPLSILTIDDLFDPKSGGVKLRDWEIDSLSAEDVYRNLFDVSEMDTDISRPGPDSQTCMYADSGLLLRGPFYYRSFFPKKHYGCQGVFSTFLGDSKAFLRAAIDVTDYLEDKAPDVFRYKLVLGLLDNVRQICLTVFSAAFWQESQQTTPDFTKTRAVFDQLALPQTEKHFDYLLDVYLGWIPFLTDYNAFLRAAVNILQDHYVMEIAETADEEIEIPGNADSGYKRYFRWREADLFIQNVTALQLALHEFQQRKDLRADQLVAVGLAFGAIELPCLAVAIAKRKRLNLTPALAHISHYNDRVIAQKVREGATDYVTDVLLQQKPVAFLSDNTDPERNAKYVLLDDNSTTGLTLQLARDFLVQQSRDVIGAVIVRFPGTNRFVHMTMEGHTGTHPEVLFNFVRGLVGPSPYTRLLYRNQDGPNAYLDQNGNFDKAKDRIDTHLRKNGSFAKDD